VGLGLICARAATRSIAGLHVDGSHPERQRARRHMAMGDPPRLVFAAYAPSQHAAFVNWDDPIHVYENPRVTSPGRASARLDRRTKARLLSRAVRHLSSGVARRGGKAWLFHVDNSSCTP